jgi:hypothetical protein
MWRGFLIMAAVGVALELSVRAVGAGAVTAAAATIAYSAIIGFVGNDWRRAGLIRRGWRDCGLVAAANREAALRRYYDLYHPPAPVSASGGDTW